MAGFLIPIKELTRTALAAVRFALEFGKRNGGSFFFLFVQDPTVAPAAESADFSEQAETENPSLQATIRQIVESQIAQAGTTAGLHIHTDCRSGDFIQEVRQFVREYHIDQIILGVSDESDDTAHAKTFQDAKLLLQLTHCRILAVKPKAKEHDPLWNLSS